ncbi:NF038104 family lipoprotein [Aromatoleum toluclasticum]|uniref:NF038104 family lipoprotein n=1 Tax=Aromatoleum toluclasticum TaxID=92003 RepID=UPI0003682349|nr:NF038104 family lipoprotein [Aromatoleum toluclasticum]MCC4118367.1 NF038104 family lipoprotein [Aromatoleum toluclasticum]
MSVRNALLAVASAAMLGGCAVVAVADAAVTVVATTVKVGAKVVGAGVDAVIPDDDDEDAKKE